MNPLAIPAPFLLLLCLSCSLASSRFLVLTPENPAIVVGQEVVISASALEDITEPQWEIWEMIGGGSLRGAPAGLCVCYKAPSVAGDWHLMATAQRPDGSRIRQRVKVTVLPSICIEPQSPTLRPGESMTFRADVSGAKDRSVKWSTASPEEGHISKEGVYIAPRRKGVYQLTAASNANANATASVYIRVG